MAALRREALRRLRTIACLALLTAACASAPAAGPSSGAGTGGTNALDQRSKPHVILISLDGFRSDYLDRFGPPALRRLAERGARASLIPVFPSKTFPNHYSLVTGLHPERHGIVGNSFLDPARDQIYSLSDRDTVSDGTWYRGEPIWVTAETQGMVAACFFWPGSEAPIRGIRATFWRAYDATISNEQRVDTVLEWLALPDATRPHVVTLYMSDVDTASHRSPIGSESVQAAIHAVDRAIGRLAEGIDRLAIRDRVYVMVTSDHGMADTSVARIVAVEDLIDMTGVRLAGSGPVANLHVSGGSRRAREVRDALNAKLIRGRAYLREEVPARLRYRADPRIGDVVVIMEESYMLESASRRARRTSRGPFGMHGWDGTLPSMQGIFVVSGPGIGPGTVETTVHTVDVYPFMTELLGLHALPGIDGRRGRIRTLLMPGGRARTAATEPGGRLYFAAAATGSRASR